jgi:hypothetical protein
VPVSKLSELALQCQVELIDDARIEPDTRHQKEVAARPIRPLQHAKGDAHRDRMEKLFRGVVGPIRESDFICEDIRGARRKNSEQDLRPGDAVRSLIDRAIPTGRKDKIAAGVNSFARKFSSQQGTGRRHEVHVRSRTLEDVHGAVEPRSSAAFQSTGERVVDESDTMG